MWVKICANTSLKDAALAAELGADAVGFVFAKSKRQVTAEQVADIIDELPPGVEKVGVFSTDDPFEIEHIVAVTGLTAAQLHRPFDAEFVQLLSSEFGGSLKIIQTVAYELDAEHRLIADAKFEKTLQAVIDEPAVWAVLIDAAKSGASGGLGVAYDWQHVAGIVQRVSAARAVTPRVIVAGGLRPENVSEAIAVFAPFGVDVASGVEVSAGVKDGVRVQRFVDGARANGDRLP